jgi:hypothetical protein
MTLERISRSTAPRGAALGVWLSIMLTAAPLPAQTDLVSFYPTAHATIIDPPAADSLHVTCTIEMRGDETPLKLKGWFSLLAPPGQPAWIAAITKAKIRKPIDALTTTPRYGPLPTARVTASATLDWAWIWDRNGDGHADYIAYLQNAQPVLPDPVPDSLPVPERGADGSYALSMVLAHAMIDNAQMIFRHYADADFNGTVDGFVVEEFDSLRPMFVRGWVVGLASKRDGVVDRAWAFRRGITDTARVIAPEPDGSYRVPAVNAAGLQSEPAAARLERGTEILRLINTLIDRCGPKNGAIRRP